MVFREAVGGTVTCFIVIYMLFFVIPVTKTAYNNEIAHLNTTSSLMQTLLPITNNWWVVFPLLIAVVGGYTIWQYASRYFGFDY